MKVKIYLRVGKKPRGSRSPVAVSASMSPNRRPLEDSGGHILPTTSFALSLDIPDRAFESAARVVAELRVPEDKLEIAAEVVELAEGECKT